jgi:hypothetical protein
LALLLEFVRIVSSNLYAAPCLAFSQMADLGVRREKLLRKARQAETAAQVNAWLRSLGSQPPM